MLRFMGVQKGWTRLATDLINEFKILLWALGKWLVFNASVY